MSSLRWTTTFRRASPQGAGKTIGRRSTFHFAEKLLRSGVNDIVFHCVSLCQKVTEIRSNLRLKGIEYNQALVAISIKYKQCENFNPIIVLIVSTLS